MDTSVTGFLITVQLEIAKRMVRKAIIAAAALVSVCADASAFLSPPFLPGGQASHNARSGRVDLRASALAQLGDRMTTLLVSSPLYPVMVKKARDTMKKTAEGAGIDWDAEVQKITDVSDLEETFTEITGGESSSEWDASKHLPAYYLAKFHAYGAGNLCWEAALEQMVAGKGVGVRNFPAYGKDGEDHMRSLHEAAMLRLGAYVPEVHLFLSFSLTLLSAPPRVPGCSLILLEHPEQPA